MGRLCKVRYRCGSHPHNDGRFPSLLPWVRVHAAPACPGFCPLLRRPVWVYETLADRVKTLPKDFLALVVMLMGMMMVWIAAHGLAPRHATYRLASDASPCRMPEQCAKRGQPRTPQSPKSRYRQTRRFHKSYRPCENVRVSTFARRYGSPTLPPRIAVSRGARTNETPSWYAQADR